MNLENNKIYSLSGWLMLDRTQINLKNIKAKYNEDLKNVGFTFEILKDQKEILKDSIKSEYLQEFLFDELEFTIGFYKNDFELKIINNSEIKLITISDEITIKTIENN